MADPDPVNPFNFDFYFQTYIAGLPDAEAAKVAKGLTRGGVPAVMGDPNVNMNTKVALVLFVTGLIRAREW